MATSHYDLIGSHFLSLWTQTSFTAATIDGVDKPEEMPMELNTVNIYGGFFNVKPDKLSVQYTGVNLHGLDVGVVQANFPVPVKRLSYYFEIFVENAGSKGQIAIGFTTDGFKMRHHPGY